MLQPRNFEERTPTQSRQLHCVKLRQLRQLRQLWRRSAATRERFLCEHDRQRFQFRKFVVSMADNPKGGEYSECGGNGNCDCRDLQRTRVCQPSGSSSSPITFQAQGSVLMQGFSISASYVIVGGFEPSN